MFSSLLAQTSRPSSKRGRVGDLATPIRHIKTYADKYKVKPIVYTSGKNVIFTVTHVVLNKTFEVLIYPSKSKIIVSLSDAFIMDDDFVEPLVVEYNNGQLNIKVYQGEMVPFEKVALYIFEALNIMNNLKDIIKKHLEKSVSDIYDETEGNKSRIEKYRDNMEQLKDFTFPFVFQEDTLINAKIKYYVLEYSENGKIVLNANKIENYIPNLKDIIAPYTEQSGGRSSANRSYVMFNKRRYKLNKNKCINVGDTLVELSSIRGKYRYVV